MNWWTYDLAYGYTCDLAFLLACDLASLATSHFYSLATSHFYSLETSHSVHATSHFYSACDLTFLCMRPRILLTYDLTFCACDLAFLLIYDLASISNLWTVPTNLLKIWSFCKPKILYETTFHGKIWYFSFYTLNRNLTWCKFNPITCFRIIGTNVLSKRQLTHFNTRKPKVSLVAPLLLLRFGV